MSKKVVLLDGNSLLYRAFYALPLLHNEKGVFTNAVYGFSNILLRIIEEEDPTHILVAFDAGKTTFRHSKYKDYKGGRQKTPPELSEQFPLIREVLKAFNISHYELDLYEADDIIGTLTHEADQKEYEVKVITGDQDLLQLVTENVTVDLTKKGISEVVSYNPDALKKNMKLNPEQIIELKALMGDSSDNIPGVPGVGIKTATKLLEQYTTIENLYEHLEEITAKKLNENLTQYKDDAFMSKALATIDTNAPIEIKLEDITYNGYEYKDIYELFSELEFKSLLQRISGEKDIVNEDLEEIDVQVVEQFTQNMFTDDTALIIEMLEENYHHADVQGIAIANKSGNYVATLEDAINSPDFKTWLEDESAKKAVFDKKATEVALKRNNIQVKGINFDSMLAAYIINPAEKHEEVAAVAKRFGYTSIQFNEAFYGRGKKTKIPEFKDLANYIGRKADAIYHIKDNLLSKIESLEMLELYKTLEIPLASILAGMELQGVRIDVEKLKEISEDLKTRIKRLEEEIHKQAGEKFNVNSPKQLGVILFEKLGLPVIKKTKTGYSTAADILEKLKDKHELIPNLLNYRQLKKLHSTYVEGLLKVVSDNTHKVHTRFNQALTQTGRLSSQDPNLQNIPIRLEEGRKLRHVFVPSQPDWVMFAADYSQIELRVLAHISADERLVQAFKENKDIHTQTARDVFHVKETEVTSNMRRQAKAVNFGIIYGISDYGLSENLQISRKEAKSFIETYFEIYPGVKKYMDDIVQTAKHDGYVSTLMKRRRYLPEITSRNFNIRSFAERTAMNTPIQGSAADIIKKAMIDLNHRLQEAQLEAKMLLQVHDELILEAPAAELETLKQIVPEVMENTVKLDIPLKVDYSYGKSWFEAK